MAFSRWLIAIVLQAKPKMRRDSAKPITRSKKEPDREGRVPFLVRVTGLEPAHRRYQILNLARLPIPPYPRTKGAVWRNCVRTYPRNEGSGMAELRPHIPTKHKNCCYYTMIFLFCQVYFCFILAAFCDFFNRFETNPLSLLLTFGLNGAIIR